MDKLKAQELIEKYNNGFLNPQEENLLEQYIEAGLIQIEDLEDLHRINQNLELVLNTEAAGRMRESFFDLLEEEKTKNQQTSFGINSFWNKLFAQSPAMRLAYSAALLIIGFGIAKMINAPAQPVDQLTALSNELSEMREMMMLSMLEKESTSDRLKAVSLTSDMGNVSEKVASALLQTLNNDPNVNVRLATLEALYPYANNPKVREGLIEAIQRQDSPHVQMALAEIMVALQEKRSAKEFKELLEKSETPEEVKEKIQNSLEVLL